MLNRLGTEGSYWCQWGRILLRQLQKQLRPCVIWNLFVSCWILTGHLFSVPSLLKKDPTHVQQGMKGWDTTLR